eukprot:434819_1
MGCITSQPSNGSHDSDDTTSTISRSTMSHINVSKFLSDEADTQRELEVPVPFKKWFPPLHGHTNIRDLFEFHREIHHSETSSIHEITYKSQICVLKQIVKDHPRGRMLFETEAHILSQLCHANIIGYIDMLMDDTYYYLVLDRADYDLYQLMSHKRSLSERRTKRIIYSILSGLQYIHSNSIVHRDLKPENVVFKAGEKDRAMLIDFGDAEMVICDKTYTEFVGTPCYMSPERLGKHNGEQLKKSDVWAVGVIAYELYSGSRCFKGGTQRRVFSRVLRGDWSWNQHRKPKQNMQDFVSKCLNPRWQHRMSANEALKHQWFADMTKLDEDTERTTIESDVSSMDNCNDDRVAIPCGASPLDEYDTVRMESFESLNDLLGNVGL